MKTKRYFSLILVAMSVFSMAMREAFVADDLVGTWKYMISDVPAEYQSGSFIFEQKENKTVGYVDSGEKNEMIALSMDQGKITFTTENQAGTFKYSLMQKADTLMGRIVSQYGDFAIIAVKQAK
ncbi:hypothetical protein [Dyadobacter sp. 32]|uniref:hypothetical protein n=1 Tax=Dyadobacter sp. 32 TaxID=538966 RepID=UPI0039C68555